MITSRHSLTRGSILLLSLVFLGIFAAVGTALLGYITDSLRASRTSVAAAQALAIAEGAADEAVSQLNKNPSYSGETNTPLGAGNFSTTVTNVDSSTKQIVVTAYVPSNTNPIASKTIASHIALSSDNIAFHYGVQAGRGGFTLNNSSSINGNVYSEGPIIGSGGNMIYGDVVSSGASGLVYGVHATSSVYAHTIGNAAAATIVDKDAYYVAKTNTTVKGILHPNSTDLQSMSLPITDAQITEWENEAAAGGTATCGGGTYSISSGSVTMGPIKIPCDLTISNSAVVTIAGPVWVLGDITVQNSATVKMAASLGSTNVAIIADNPSDQITSSTISVVNTAVFKGSGAAGSFVFLISQNKSAETGGNVPAFSLGNSANALVAYAAHGLIPLANTVSLKEVTAYNITLQNSSNVTYDTGLPNTVFASGPGGSWAMATGTYAIVK